MPFLFVPVITQIVNVSLRRLSCKHYIYSCACYLYDIPHIQKRYAGIQALNPRTAGIPLTRSGSKPFPLGQACHIPAIAD